MARDGGLARGGLRERLTFHGGAYAGMIEARGPSPDGPMTKGPTMAHTYGITEVVGSSTDSLDDAIRTAVSRADSTVRGLDWFEVTEIRGHLEEGAIAHYQVGLKIGFRLED